MRTVTAQPTLVRDAMAADLPALVAIKGLGTDAVHRDRLKLAESDGFRYLVLAGRRTLLGFACLVARRPTAWSDADDTGHLPQIIDLQVHPAQRGRGYGSAFLRTIARIVAEAGYSELYVSVEPRDNPRAFALYQRLGYQALQKAPYLKRWTFIDSAGNAHRGANWVVDMVTDLRR